ncbi:thioredoxin domain-containing protein [Psychromonas sp. KJ10-2]|uniref:thioredoxin domain-containing protein n=1 Tax=Psychromonas sp. KJ10-2 TaxID=3391822 RepID=UPI0039B6BC1B
MMLKKQKSDFDSLSALISSNAENGGASDKQLGDYLMDNPEKIIKSLAKYRFLQEQESNKVAKNKVESFNAALYEDETDPVLGNPKGKHVVVEFVDNNCGYCKALAPTLEEFVRIDPEAKVIVKEFPIFKTNPSSRYSALMGTAIWLADPSKYADFHHKTMKTLI